jgi:hypothetical protein
LKIVHDLPNAYMVSNFKVAIKLRHIVFDDAQVDIEQE